MEPIYEVTIKVTREEETIKSREWFTSKELEKDESGYGPQCIEVQQVDRTLVKMEVGPYLDVGRLVRAILEASEPPLINTQIGPGDAIDLKPSA